MAGEKLVQKALQAAMEARAAKHVADPAERAANLAKFLSRSHAKNTETGDPIRLYHITPETNIDALKAGGNDPSISGMATWLSPYADEQPAYHNVGSWKNKFKEGTNVMPVYANLERPLLIDTPEMISWAQSVYGREFPLLVSPKTRQMLIDDGYDSVIYGGGKNPEEYAAKGLQIGQQANRDEQVLSLFPETQLKSATGNIGTFNPSIPRLTENHGGEVREHHADGERVSYDVRSVDPRFGEYSLTPREEGSLPRAVQLARSIIDAQPSVPVHGAPVDMSLSPQFAGMAHAMGKTPIGAVGVPVAGGNLHLQGGYDPLTKFEHYGARYTRPFADGGEVRAGFDEGGFLSKIFSGEDYQSNSEPLIKDGQINWGDPNNPADYFRAASAMQRATELAKKVQEEKPRAPRSPEPEPAPPVPQPPQREPASPAPAAEAIETVAPAPVLSTAERRTWDSNRPGVRGTTTPAEVAEIMGRRAPTVSAPAAPAPQAMPYAPVPSTEEVAKLTNRVAPGPDLTDRQRDLIVRTIAAETSGKSPEETRAIAHVILNRIQSGKFGATPEQVLFAKNQFEPWTNPAGLNYPMRISPQSQRYVSSAQALDAALGGEDITGGASHFWGPASQFALGRQAPSWGRTGGVDIGATRFHKVTDVAPAPAAPSMPQQPAQPSVGLFAFGTNDANEKNPAAGVDTALKSAQRIYDEARRAGMQPVFVLPNANDPKFAPVSDALRKFAEERGIQYEAPSYDPKDALHITPKTAQDLAKKYPGAFVAGDSNSWRLQRYGYGRPVADQKSFIDPRSGVTLGRVGAGSSEIAKAFKEYVDSLSKGRADGGEVREHHADGKLVGKALQKVWDKLAAGRALPEEQRMMVTHNAGPNAIKFYSEIGGLPAPSMGIFKPAYGAERFGEVKLIGKPEVFAVPSAENPIFGADAYTPRLGRAQRQSLAEIAAQEGRPPLDVFTEWLRMNGTRGGEAGVGGPGYIRSMVAPEFQTLDELQGARDLLVHKRDMSLPMSTSSAQYQNFLEKMRQQPHMRGFNVTDFAEAAHHGPDWFNSRYYMTPPELQSRFRDYIEHLRTMPTEYFEGKPQRAVKGEDFAGALVQEGSNALSTAKDLEKLGIGNIQFYRHQGELGNPKVQAEKFFQHFPDQMFNAGGEVEREHHADGNIVGKALKAIRAWHGSPHKFEEFDISKVGTGEGQQRYGKGIYFAQDKNLAQQFMGNPEDRYRRLSGHMTPQEEIAFDYANRPGARDMDIMSALVKRYGNDISFEQANELARQAMARRGALYEVDIKPEMQSFLDWNRRLSEQPEYVRELLTPKNLGLREAGPLPGGERFGWVDESGKPIGSISTLRAPENPFGEASGGNIYNMIGRNDPSRATDILRDIGIPGITYRDPSGFGKAGAPQNFVIFDPAKDVEILNRYNKGGEVLSDKYPTHYLPNVGRQVMQDGGTPEMSMTRARKLAIEELGRSEDKPPMDPAVMGENWANAVQRMRVPDYAVYKPNEPRRDPAQEQFVRPLELGARDIIGGAIAGDEANNTYLTEIRRRAADALVGSKGLPGSGTVGFGLADLPMVTGIPLTVADLGQSVREGDYLGAGVGAALPAAVYARGPLGAAGKRALEIAREYAPKVAPAATAAAVMAPDDAEAAKAKAVQQAINIVRTAERPMSSRIVSQAGEHGYFVPQTARERDPRLWHPISNTVLSRPLGEMHAEHVITAQPAERRFIRPEDLEGAALIPALGDRTAGGSLLTRINEMALKSPTEMQAGHSFMFGPASKGSDFAAWASDPGIIAALANKTRKAAEAGYDPYLSYVAMGSRSGDYSHHMTDTLLNMLPGAKPTKATIAEFDRQMRENVANKWDPYTDWPGLKSKNLEAYLYGEGPAKARTKMAELMGQGQFQKAGMPDVGAARFAITDPALLHAADYSAGHSITKLDPTGRVIKEPTVPHKTYKVQLGADPEKGYVGGFEYDIPFNVMNKEWIDNLMAVDPKKYSNPSMLAYTYRMHQPTTIMTPEVVDRLSKYLDARKRGLIP